jgi:hypothetical protein
MSYSQLAEHAAMLFDANRNGLYAAALRRMVGPGSVVLDLGAGLGLHGLLAAAAGASRVYLVEPQPVVNIAAEVARANGLQDRVVIIQKPIEETNPPELVDLIVSVFTGNLLFSEDLLPLLFEARERWLKPQGRLLPDRAQLWLAPLEATRLHEKHVAGWSKPVAGLDYGVARRFAANEVLWLAREEFKGTRSLSEGGCVADVHLANARNADCDGRARCPVAADGTCHGLLGWIRMQLDGEWLSTHPDAPAVHWLPVMLPLDPPLALERGEVITLGLQRPARGDWTWSIEANSGTRRHSSFLARAETPAAMLRIAPDSRAGLGRSGRRMLLVLSLLDQGFTNRAAAQELATAEGMDPAEAMDQVQAIAMRHGAKP